MLKKFLRKKWVLIIAAILILAVAGGIVIMVGQHRVNIRGQRLNRYTYSSGGGMNGGYYDKTVTRLDDAHALICIESAEWHNQDPEIREYLVDASVMDELAQAVRKYKMNHWNRKEFTNLIIMDGESKGYHFRFDEAVIDFSSQLYPAKYRNKLRHLDEILDNCLKDAEALPGLVRERADDGDFYDLPEGELELYVCSYRSDSLVIRILNGKDEAIELSSSCRLMNTDTGEVLYELETDYPNTVYPNTRDVLSLSLKERLDAGNYTIILGEIEIPFEIR